MLDRAMASLACRLSPGSAFPLPPASSTQTLHKAAPPHLLVLGPAKIKGTQGLRAEYAFIYTEGKK